MINFIYLKFMKKGLILSFILLCISVNSQQKFEIIFESEVINDTIKVYAVFLDKEMGLFQFDSGQKSSIFKLNDKTVLKGKVDGVYPVSVWGLGNESEYFFISPGKNYINSLNDPYNEEYRLIKSKLHNLYEVYELGDLEEIKKASLDNDRILSKYIWENNNSLVAFYLLANRLLNHGKINQFIEEGLNGFSNDFKNSEKYKFLFEKYKILSSNTLFTDNIFHFKDISLNDVEIDFKQFQNKKYVLVDFWFSYCGPCIAQFPDYKDIYSEYKNRGFEIVNISTDKSKFISRWKKVIKEKGLDWVQYLDENGVEALKLNITIFPTNFLLDDSGKVILKNIHPEELRQFLKENL